MAEQLVFLYVVAVFFEKVSSTRGQISEMTFEIRGGI